MKKMVTEVQRKVIEEAHESVLGTTNYTKYLMCMERKYRKDGKWTHWIFMKWTVPSVCFPGTYYFKSIKDKLYIMRDYPDGNGVERYEVTPAVKELLNI